MKKSSTTQAKPFLKWAGGKTQLLNEIEKKLPKDFSENNYTFIEPFIGGGAVMFWILNKYSNIKNVIINDINTDLTNCYKTIKSDVNNLIKILSRMENEYHRLTDDIQKKKTIIIRKELYLIKKLQLN